MYLLEISELHWKYNSHFQSDDFSVYYSGQELKRNVVAFIAHKNIARAVDRYTNIMVLHVLCAPRTDATEDEIKHFYGKIEEALEQVPKKNIIYIMGDFNTKVGSQEEVNIIG